MLHAARINTRIGNKLTTSQACYSDSW